MDQLRQALLKAGVATDEDASRVDRQKTIAKESRRKARERSKGDKKDRRFDKVVVTQTIAPGPFYINGTIKA
jgi:hypothetical protein